MIETLAAMALIGSGASDLATAAVPPLEPRFVNKLAAFARATRIRDIGIVEASSDNRSIPFIALLGGAAELTRLLERRFWLTGITAMCRAGNWAPRETARFLENLSWRDVSCWDDLESTMREALADSSEDYENLHSILIPIPDPGGPQARWYSCIERTWKNPVGVKPYRFCDQQALDIEIVGDVSAAGVIVPGREKGLPFFVTHGLDRAHFKAVSGCSNRLLFPSLAVTWRVPPSYGEVIFVGSTSLLTTTLAPMGRTNPRLLLSPTDLWSPTGKDLLQEERAITRELIGDLRFWSGDLSRDDGGSGHRGLQADLVVSGLTREEMARPFMAPDDYVRLAEQEVTSFSELEQRLQFLEDAFRDLVTSGDPYDYDDYGERPTWSELSNEARYPYLEMKALGTVGLNLMAACFYPRKIRVAVERFLDAVGFKGDRVPVTCRTGWLDGVSDKERALWAAAMTKGILAWSKQPGKSIRA